MKGEKVIFLIGALVFFVIGIFSYGHAQMQTIRLKAAFWVPPHGYFAASQDWFLKEIESRSKGRIVFERYWGQSLVGAREIPDALAGGVADVGSILPGYYPGKFPLADVGSLPSIAEHNWPALMALHELFRTVPEVKEESAKRGIKMFLPIGSGPYYILTKKKEIRKIEDMKGLKLRSLGYQAKLVQALGGNPVSMPITEVFDALHKGTIDGVVCDADIAHNYGLDRGSKYFTTVPFGCASFFMGISIKAFSALPAELQKMIEDAIPDGINAFTRIYELEGLEKQAKGMEKEGVKFISFPAAEAEKVKKISMEKIWGAWVEDLEKKGLAGKKTFEAYRKSVEFFAAKDPHKY
jgi:TRAP-type C4-dicarboxylate transport system substrate-binding protein